MYMLNDGSKPKSRGLIESFVLSKPSSCAKQHNIVNYLPKMPQEYHVSSLGVLLNAVAMKIILFIPYYAF